MERRIVLLCLLLMSGCARKIGNHLQIAPPPAPRAAIASLHEAVERTLAGDALARRSVLIDDEQLADIENTGALRAFGREVRALESSNGSPASVLGSLLQTDQLQLAWNISISLPCYRCPIFHSRRILKELLSQYQLLPEC